VIVTVHSHALDALTDIPSGILGLRQQHKHWYHAGFMAHCSCFSIAWNISCMLSGTALSSPMIVRVDALVRRGRDGVLARATLHVPRRTKPCQKNPPRHVEETSLAGIISAGRGSGAALVAATKFVAPARLVA
jgi:hypothetical protein